MTKEEFLQRLIELCKLANVKLDQFSQLASADEHYQTAWSFDSKERDSEGMFWFLEIDDRLATAIETAQETSI